MVNALRWAALWALSPILFLALPVVALMGDNWEDRWLNTLLVVASVGIAYAIGAITYYGATL